MCANRIPSPTQGSSVAWPVDVLVVVPAHDEEQRIEACLDSVIAAVDRARSHGVVDEALLGVAAHRCADGTVARATRLLEQRAVAGAVWQDTTSTTVGEVRHRAVRRLSAQRARSARPAWLFNTDADSTVPVDWICTLLESVHGADAHAAAGLVDLVDWWASPKARRDYRRVIEQGLGPTGHTHVYGANLAIRMDAYDEVGGFPSVGHGEDHAIVQRLRSAGLVVLTPRLPVVRTSGRMPGRAAHGLGALLQSLASDAEPVTGTTLRSAVPDAG